MHKRVKENVMVWSKSISVAINPKDFSRKEKSFYTETGIQLINSISIDKWWKIKQQNLTIEHKLVWTR